MRNNTVSVIIPCYNQGHFLPEAIESVLSQTYKDFEIIIVDDGSTDNTKQVVRSYNSAIYIGQENMGLASARNTGFKNSKGSYLVFLDADDRLLPKALEYSLGSFETHPKCAFVYGKYQHIASDGSPLQTPEHIPVEKEYYIKLLRRNYIGVPSTVMYQRDYFENVGGFRNSAGASEDYDLYIRIASRYPIHYHGKDVVEYRIHDGSWSNNCTRMLKFSVTVRRSHWTYVKGNPKYEEALAIGIRVVQEYYGKLLISELLNHKKLRIWDKFVANLLTLIRYHPLGFINLVSPKIYNTFFAKFEGSLDSHGCHSISGWVWDKNRPNTPIELEIYADNVKIATVLANGFRRALEEEGKGNGLHAFYFDLANEFRKNQPHSIRVRIAGTSTEIKF